MSDDAPKDYSLKKWVLVIVLFILLIAALMLADRTQKHHDLCRAVLNSPLNDVGKAVYLNNYCH